VTGVEIFVFARKSRHCESAAWVSRADAFSLSFLQCIVGTTEVRRGEAGGVEIHSATLLRRNARVASKCSVAPVQLAEPPAAERISVRRCVAIVIANSCSAKSLCFASRV
jgi:hypothetical protein